MLVIASMSLRLRVESTTTTEPTAAVWCPPVIVTIFLLPGIQRALLIAAGQTVLFLYTWSEPLPSGRTDHRLCAFPSPLSTYSQRV